MNENGQIKLCDFGESRILENNIATTAAGTIVYWPPERISGQQREYDSRSDIWSLGVTLSELVYGKLPFETEEGQISNNYFTIMFHILSLNAEELIEKCFKRTNYTLARDFVAKCLQKCENRPTYEELLSTELYKKFSSLSIYKIVKQFFPIYSSKLSQNFKLAHYAKQVYENDKIWINFQNLPFNVSRRYILCEQVGLGNRGITM